MSNDSKYNNNIMKKLQTHSDCYVMHNRLLPAYVLIMILFVVSVGITQAQQAADENMQRADFTGCVPVPVKNDLPVHVKFTDTSVGEPVRWAWDFGDGGYSYEPNPLYKYYAEGCCYTVSLTVDFAGGTTDTVIKEDCVCIGECPPKLIIEPTDLQVDYGAGTAYVLVSNGGLGDMDWVASVTQGGYWLTIDSGESGANAGIIEVSYSANPFFTAREGIVKVVSAAAADVKEITIHQAARTGGSTSITCTLSDDVTVIGIPVTVSGTVTTADGAAVLNAQVEITEILPDGTNVQESTQTTSEGKYEITLLPGQIGTWLIEASWQGDQHYDGAGSPQKKLIVSKAGTKLSLNLSSKSIAVGGTVTARGALGTVPYTTRPRSNMDIVLEIIPPGAASVITQETITNSSGEYVFSDLKVFDEPGEWVIQAVFNGNQSYDTTFSEKEKVNVYEAGQTGYAILVQGNIESEEGIETHRKTIGTVYNILSQRNILQDNIKVFGDGLAGNIDHAMPTRQSIESAIAQWAYSKMSRGPAPLYIVLLGHGNVEKFHIYPEIIIPSDLDAWLTGLEAKLQLQSYDFEKNPVCILIGTCASGSFIPGISKTGRAVMTSAADNESAVRGPLEEDGTREGSYFLSEFFRNTARGKSLKESFEDTTAVIEEWTKDPSSGSSVNAAYRDSARQHPLIDDNGDGQGNNITSAIAGEDGSAVMYQYLGTSSLTGQLEIVAVSPHITLSPTDSLPILWIEVSDPSLVETIRLEIKPPDFTYPDVDISEQIEMEGVVSVLYNPDNVEGRKFFFDQYGTCDFSEPGTYEIFYFVKDTPDKKILQPHKTFVYRTISTNRPPEAFSLVAPSDKAELNNSPVLFDWETASDPDGDPLTYSFYISEDTSFKNPVVIIDGIETSSVVIDIGSRLQDGNTYYWKAAAVDSFGGTTDSEQIWSFYKDFNNIVLGLLEGYVTDAASAEPLSDVKIRSNCGAEAFSDNGIFWLPCVEGSYTGSAAYDGYKTEWFNFTIIAGATTYIDVPMQKGSDPEPDNATFTAIPFNKRVVLQWVTDSEIAHAGFNLFRAEAQEGEYVQINDALLSTQGTEYEFVDAEVENRRTYYYKLEDVDVIGMSTMHGPVSATPRFIYGDN